MSFISRLGAAAFLTLLNSVWVVPAMALTAVPTVWFIRKRPGTLARPPILLAAVLAWPLFTLGWAAAFGVPPRTPISPWHMRLLCSFLVVQAALAIVSVRRTPPTGRTRQVVAVAVIVAWWIGATALFIASLAFGGAPI